MIDTSVPKPAGEAPEEDPFADFDSHEFEAGEEVTRAPADPPKKSAAPVEDEDGDGEGDDGDDGGDDDDSSRPKGKQSAQERINELTRLRREAERRAEAMEAQLEELRSSQTPPKEPEPKAAPKPEAKAPKGDDEKAPTPDDFDYGELDPRYIQALSRYEVRQEYKALREADAAKEAERAAIEEQAKVQEKFQEQIDRGSKKHEDFYEKVIVGAEKGEWPLSDDLGKLLVESEVGDDIAYHLASHPEEAAQVYRQTPLEQARYFGRMEAKFSADQSAAPGTAGKTVETRTPKAPPPVVPARGSDGKFSPSASTSDFAAFEALANQQ